MQRIHIKCSAFKTSHRSFKNHCCVQNNWFGTFSWVFVLNILNLQTFTANVTTASICLKRKLQMFWSKMFSLCRSKSQVVYACPVLSALLTCQQRFLDTNLCSFLPIFSDMPEPTSWHVVKSHQLWERQLVCHDYCQISGIYREESTANQTEEDLGATGLPIQLVQW